VYSLYKFVLKQAMLALKSFTFLVLFCIFAIYNYYNIHFNPTNFIRMKKILLLLIGIGIGIAMALLYAPQSGKKTRRKLQKRAKKLQLELEATAEKKMEDFNDWKISIEELAEDAAKQVNSNGSMNMSSAQL